MATLRCPMCGKDNPEELDTCRFCGARLKPLLAGSQGDKPIQRDTSEFEKIKLPESETIKPGQAPTKKSTAELEHALPSWLRSLRGDGSAEAENAKEALEGAEEGSLPPLPGSTAPKKVAKNTDLLAGLSQAASEEEEQVPDWLSGLRAKKAAEEGAQAQPEAAPEAAPEPELGNVDWLSRLGGEPKQAEASPEETKAEAPAGDWLKNLQNGEAAAPEAPAEDFPDWSANLAAAAQETPATHKNEPAPAPAELPDWLAQLKEEAAASSAPRMEAEQPTPEAEPPASSEETPDWLNLLQDKAAPNQPAQADAEAEALPNWLADLPAEPKTEAATPETGGDLSGWLSSLEPKAPAEETPAAAPATNMPDWLSSLEPKAAMEEPPAAAPAEETQAALPADNVPDWLSGMQENAVPEETAAPAENLPNWLSGMEEKSVPEEVQPAQPEEKLPDWLSQAGEQAAPAAEIPAAPAQAIPDWLSSAEEKPTQAAASEALPDWLASAEQKAPEAAEPTEEPVRPKETGPLPNWLQGIEKTPAPEGVTPALIQERDIPRDEPGGPAFIMETPDWLAKLKPDQGVEKPAEGEEGAENLQAAELPSWVQAMRPVESVVEEKSAPAGEDVVTEQSGPLAGLVGVLPAGPGLGPIRKPPTYSIKLQLSETHQRYVSFFDKLIEAETKSKPIKKAKITSQLWWRIAISAILLLTMLLPFLGGTALTPPVRLPSGDTAYSASGAKGGAQTVIEGLPQNAAVLIAFDYEPAYASELEAIAAPLVDQLMNKGARLALISTTPTGSVLGETFIQNAPLVNTHGYTPDNQFTDLGYLAGGPGAIAAFATAPNMAMPYTTSGQTAWDKPVLQGVGKLSDFAAIFILTDNADTGRDWIEQSGQYLGSTPMVMVVSARAEPMLRPYFDSGQVKGLAAGLLDARIYEQAFNRPGLANHYWDSYSLAALAAIILIVLGGAWGALMKTRADASGGEGA